MNDWNSILSVMQETAAAMDCEVYMVGGAVRDILRGVKDLNDIDFTVIGGDYAKFARNISRRIKSRAIAFKDNIRIPYDGGNIDISAPRGNTIAEDQTKRDFTINNLAMNTAGQILGDDTDLRLEIIRPVSKNVFDDDPLRILRGFRLAANLSYKLSDEFITLADKKVPLLSSVANERINDELQKLSRTACDPLIYTEMQRLGVWGLIFGAEVRIDMLEKTFDITVCAEERYAVFLSSLLRDTDLRPLERLGVSNAAEKTVRYLLKGFYAMDGGDIERFVWRYMERFPLLADFCEAHGRDVSAYRKTYERMIANDIQLLNGHDIIRIAKKVSPHLRRGRWFADVLDESNFLLKSGKLSDRNEALKFAEREVLNASDGG